MSDVPAVIQHVDSKRYTIVHASRKNAGHTQSMLTAQNPSHYSVAVITLWSAKHYAVKTMHLEFAQ